MHLYGFVLAGQHLHAENGIAFKMSGLTEFP